MRTGEPLRVAIVAPPFYELPPRTYGGTELVCYVLAEALAARGHDVTLVGAGPRTTVAEFVATFPDAQPEELDAGEGTIEILHAARTDAALRRHDLDLIHEHTRAGILMAGSRPVPTIATVHAPQSGPESHPDLWLALGEIAPLVAISHAQRRQAAGANWLGVRHHGIPLSNYRFGSATGDHAVFLGRMSPSKGVERAIAAARAAQVDLVLAGSWTIPAERAYFDEVVRPRLGPGVEWVGEVDATRKNDLLGSALCLLAPVAWEEPFGLVLIEAMACGTPVVAMASGAVPEIVRQGVTGFACRNEADLPSAIDRCRGLSRERCRRHVADHFSAEVMAEGYEVLYRQVLASRAG